MAGMSFIRKVVIVLVEVQAGVQVTVLEGQVLIAILLLLFPNLVEVLVVDSLLCKVLPRSLILLSFPVVQVTLVVTCTKDCRGIL